ncbi:MAG: ABC transporter ATP-binding protein/permease [Anaerolineae bacterium]|nr:ABC transporter ATP-binding protein/permease [Anaerolineae bacterium]MDW8170885.1 ABC transporter ATP-binding protein [Anaerolineae bacterium]
MAQIATKATTADTFNVKATLAHNRLLGLWRLLKGYRPMYLSATLSLGVAALLMTGGVLLIRYFVDNILVRPDESFMTAALAVALLYVAMQAVRGFFSFRSNERAARVSESVALRLKDYLFDHLQHLPFAYHDKMPTGELIQRVTSDVDAIRLFFAEQLIGIGRIFVLFVVNFAALLFLHAPLALLSVLVIPIVMVLSLFFFRRVSAAYEDFQEQDAVVSRTVQENLSGVRVVKAFARQDFEKQRFEGENHKKFRLGTRFMTMHAIYWPFTDVLMGLQTALGYLAASLMVLDGQITLGTYVAYVGVVWWIIDPVRNLGRLIVQVSEAMVSYDRLSEVIRPDWEDMGYGLPAPVSQPQGRLKFEGVSFEYEPGKPVLHDISFEVEPGQAVALLGSTGSGKTSLMALLTRFYDYTGGRITLDGVDLKAYPRVFLRNLIGVVEQEPFLFSTTIRNNIAYGVYREVSQEEIEAAARAAAAHDFIASFPEGYNTLVGERGVTLSGGQKQRVALARTLLKNPRILILDDATSSVDTQTESQIREALDGLMSQRTSFVIAHRIQSVMNADLILVMDKGRIVQRGTHEQLMAERDGIYRKTYDMQASIETELERELSYVGLAV